MAIQLARKAGWGRKSDLPLAYDFESANGQSAPKCARHLLQFVDAYRKARPPPDPLHGPELLDEHRAPVTASQRNRARRCPLWIAHWEVPQPQSLEPWGDEWMLWQHSDRGRIPGVSTKCDTDYFRGGADDFANLIVS